MAAFHSPLDHSKATFREQRAIHIRCLTARPLFPYLRSGFITTVLQALSETTLYHLTEVNLQQTDKSF